MLKMILDLLDVEGLEEGRLAPTADRVDMTELARVAVDDAEVSARQKDVRLDLVTTEKIVAEADPVLMRPVIDNLLANALQHSPSGGRVEVAAAYREEGVELRVSDDGPGIPEELREKVFEKYAQVEMKRQGAGSTNRGLGLTFCRLAVEAQGGTIWVESGPRSGACFVTILPASVADDAPARLDAVARG
jgi:signal transduction histidine kinase